MSMIGQSAIFLGAAVVTVPLFKKLGLGSVLGFLSAGILIGPWGLGTVDNVDDILHFSEFGVVLLLFIIGLELQPSRLMELRKPIFGYGGLQMGVSTVLLTLIALYFGLAFSNALLVALVLSLSSTAFALQLLAEKQQLTTRHGRSAFAILLFQDMAVIPLIALIPFFGNTELSGQNQIAYQEIGIALLAIALVIGIGRYLMRPFFRLVAATHSHEIFTAASLLVVIATSLAMDAVGLSMSLGAFLAGVLLADSEFRHELEANIEPFKGLLLGLFFIAVGMAVDLGIILERPGTVIGLALGLIAIKAAVLFGLGRVTGLNTASSRHLAVVISQGGEFAFVLFTIASQSNVLDPELVKLLIVVVTVSMMLTPVLLILDEWYSQKPADTTDQPYDEVHESNQVIIAGFGRVAQIIARILHIQGIGYTALEKDFEQVDFVRKYGNKIYYGDPTRLDLLRAAQADKAQVFVVAVDDIEASLEVTRLVRKHFPHLKIYARARNRAHAHQLMKAGVHGLMRETILSSIALAQQVLEGLGLPHNKAVSLTESFLEYDERLLREQFYFADDEDAMANSVKQATAELESLYELDDQSSLEKRFH